MIIQTILSAHFLTKWDFRYIVASMSSDNFTHGDVFDTARALGATLDCNRLIQLHGIVNDLVLMPSLVDCNEGNVTLGGFFHFQGFEISHDEKIPFCISRISVRYSRITIFIIWEFSHLSSTNFNSLSPNYGANDIMLSMVNKIDFPEWLKKQMDLKGIRSNAELARLANLGKDGRAVVWGWINQGKQPSEENLQKIARALKIPTEEAYRAAGILPPIPAKDAWTERIANLVNQLPDEEKERIYRHAEMIKNIVDEKKKPQISQVGKTPNLGHDFIIMNL